MWGGRKSILVRWIICHEPFRRFISFATLRLADTQCWNRRPAMWYHIDERAARDRRFFFSPKLAFFSSLKFIDLSGFEFQLCILHVLMERIDGRTSEQTKPGIFNKYVFVFVLCPVCVGRCGDIMCVTTAVAFEQNFLHYNLALYLHCHVYWIML